MVLSVKILFYKWHYSCKTGFHAIGAPGGDRRQPESRMASLSCAEVRLAAVITIYQSNTV